MQDQKLLVGSIKTIIGHTEGTAGLASLLKTALALQHGEIAPNLHLNHLNPAVKPFFSNLEIPTSFRHWPKLADGAVKRASVNSFGFGGAVSDTRPTIFHSSQRAQTIPRTRMPFWRHIKAKVMLESRPMSSFLRSSLPQVRIAPYRQH